MGWAHSDGALYYERDVPASWPTVVFVEGLGYGRWMWNWQRERVGTEFAAVVWDNRGTGDSETPDIPWLVRKLPGALRRPLVFSLFGYSMAEMARDLEAVLAAAGVGRAHLVGASMGGMIAQEYALTYDRAETLTLLCTSHGGPDAVATPEETRERMFEVPAGADERETIRHRMRPAMTDEWMAANDAVVERIVDWRLASDAGPAAREAQAAGVVSFDASDGVAGIEVPALVMHGTADRVVPVANGEMLHEKLPDAELELYEGAPHLFMIERADAVNDRLADFLSSHAR